MTRMTTANLMILNTNDESLLVTVRLSIIRGQG